MVDLYGHETCTNTVASVSNGFEWGIGCCHGLPSLRSLTTPKQPKAWGPQRLRKKTHCWCKVIVSKFPSIIFIDSIYIVSPHRNLTLINWLYWFLKVQFSFQIWNIWTVGSACFHSDFSGSAGAGRIALLFWFSCGSLSLFWLADSHTATSFGCSFSQQLWQCNSEWLRLTGREEAGVCWSLTNWHIRGLKND